MGDELRVDLLRGGDIARHVDALAQLRIAVFREFPYLYDGTAEYEAHYLQTYIASPDSLIVMVRDGEKAVGASTSLPLAAAHEEMQEPFQAAGLPLKRYHYFGESLLLRAYRGRAWACASSRSARPTAANWAWNGQASARWSAPRTIPCVRRTTCPTTPSGAAAAMSESQPCGAACPGWT